MRLDGESGSRHRGIKGDMDGLSPYGSVRDGAAVIVNYSGNHGSPLDRSDIEAGERSCLLLSRATLARSETYSDSSTPPSEHFGKLDILVNNAGIMFNKPVAEVTEQEYDRIFAVNVKGTFFACQQAAKRMADGGRIINFSSSTTAMMLPTDGTSSPPREPWSSYAHPCQRARFEGHHGERHLAGTDRHGVV